jgi:predicted PurR-regulated permease PerM
MARFDIKSTGRTAGTALVNWWRAVSLEALCVAVMWLIGLWLLHVPLFAVWALIGGLMAFVPNFGGVIALLGPVFSILFSGKDIERLGFVLGLYAVIVIVDQVLIQPALMSAQRASPSGSRFLRPSCWES